MRMRDRGSDAITSLLSYIFFNILPTLVDILIAVVYFTTTFGSYYGSVKKRMINKKIKILSLFLLLFLSLLAAFHLFPHSFTRSLIHSLAHSLTHTSTLFLSLFCSLAYAPTFSSSDWSSLRPCRCTSGPPSGSPNGARNSVATWTVSTMLCARQYVHCRVESSSDHCVCLHSLAKKALRCPPFLRTKLLWLGWIWSFSFRLPPFPISKLWTNLLPASFYFILFFDSFCQELISWSALHVTECRQLTERRDRQAVQRQRVRGRPLYAQGIPK